MTSTLEAVAVVPVDLNYISITISRFFIVSLGTIANCIMQMRSRTYCKDLSIPKIVGELYAY